MIINDDLFREKLNALNGEIFKLTNEQQVLPVLAIHKILKECEEEMTDNKGDLISREALKEEVDTWGCEYDKYDFIEAIDNAPTVSFVISPNYVAELQNLNKELIKRLEEVDRGQGEWIKDEDHSITINMFKCSNCNGGGYTHFKYCPHCGSEMGVRNDDI